MQCEIKVLLPAPVIPMTAMKISDPPGWIESRKGPWYVEFGSGVGGSFPAPRLEQREVFSIFILLQMNGRRGKARLDLILDGCWYFQKPDDGSAVL